LNTQRMDEPVVAELRSVGRVFTRGSSTVTALDGVSLTFSAGESVAVTGPSGSGKSTLLSILGCLDRPTSGEYLLDGEPVEKLSDDRLSGMRNSRIGFVFQSFHLIPQLSILENVEAALLYSARDPSEWRQRATAVLESVGLIHRADHSPSELSGGEAQRAAIARALVNEPRLLLADEPTGNLDSATGDDVARLLLGLSENGKTVVIVTHNERLAERADRVVRLRDGRVESMGAP
jgi:putative ABC transport system ATP-binding protein